MPSAHQIEPVDLGQQPKSSKSTKTVTTTRTTVVRTTAAQESLRARPGRANEAGASVALVEELGRQANSMRSAPASGGRTNTNGLANRAAKQAESSSEVNYNTSERLASGSETVNGNKLVTTLGTLAAQSGKSRIVLALLKDGDSLQLKIQEMRPGIFEVGANYKQCTDFLEEHQKLVRNVRKQRETPLENWMGKYEKICATSEPNMSTERKLVYMCMAENLQGCWRALLGQLDKRLHLLGAASRFYECADLNLVRALDKAEQHVQLFRQEFLNGPNSAGFHEACEELRHLNQVAWEQFQAARSQQRQLVALIAEIGSNNLGDSRPNHLIEEAKNLIEYISAYLDPLERRRIQLESVISTSCMDDTTSKTTITKTTTTTNTGISSASGSGSSKKNENNTNSLNVNQPISTNRFEQLSFIDQDSSGHQNGPQGGKMCLSGSSTTRVTNTTSYLREISNFNDFNLVDNWLNLKIEQLNSSLLSSLGVSVTDSRSILSKHEQIALECRAIEEATLTFNGRNIHAIKSLEPRDDKRQAGKSLFEQQKSLAVRTRDVITILDARIVLLRRTIDFYQRSKEATSDIAKMMRRLQVDNSLQSVQFVSNELEFKDVSSVVASGATIISELQQLQLAQQHGQRSRIVNLNLVTNGIRAIIDQLNQDLAHLKTVLNQRRLVLLNEDAAKMAHSFSSKCQQLQQWLNNHAKSFLVANERLLPAGPGQDALQQVRNFCDTHEQLRVAVQNKTLEVEALLRSLPTLTENFDAKSQAAEEIHKATDELRQDWINVTNCLDRRLELARKYLAILNAVGALDKELAALAGCGGLSANGERSEEDIRANVDQSLYQLANQVRNFQLGAQKTNTDLVYSPSTVDSLGTEQAAAGRELDGRAAVSDINKQQLVEHAGELLDRCTEHRRALSGQELDGSKRAPDERQRVINNNTDSKKDAQKQQPPAHQRPQQTDPPRFSRVLQDRAVEPFSTVELECETDEANCQVEWFMNNLKKISPNIKHSTTSEGNLHRLTITNFGPVACGTYQVRATNAAGQAVSQCRLRLSGIKETQEGAPSGQPAEPREQVDRRPAQPQKRQQLQDSQSRGSVVSLQQNFQVSSPAVSSTSSSFSQWRPAVSNQRAAQQRSLTREPKTSTTTTTSTTTASSTSTSTTLVPNDDKSKAMSRIIRGVESSERDDEDSSSLFEARRPGQPRVTISQVASDTESTDTRISSDRNSATGQLFPATQSTYSGPSGAGSSPTNQPGQQLVRVHSSTSTDKRSDSKSPFEGTPQPPLFLQGLSDSIPRCCSRAGLVCLVVGNPPPTIEWLHNNQTIATTKCAQRDPATGGCPSRANLCKLTIETVNQRTQGQYVCRATNRLGQTSTGLTLAK